MTADVRGAGTSSRVWLGIEGDEGLLGGRKLELDNSLTNFERGMEDTYLLEEDGNVGEVHKVRFVHAHTACNLSQLRRLRSLRR